MGFPSYLEDIEERRYENYAMIAAWEQRLAPKAMPVAVTQIVAPVKLPAIVSRRQADDRISRRTRDQRDTHILALAELMPKKAIYGRTKHRSAA
jgi:hypothetical protein